MGTLLHFDVADLVRSHGLRNFVETGTYKGDSVEHALRSGVPGAIVSIEISQGLWEEAAARFFGLSTVTILRGSSEEMLPEAIARLDVGPTLWWLDAHLQELFGVPSGSTCRFPLEAELRLIAGLRDVSADVFLIDDLRIYEDGPFVSGQSPAEHSCTKAGTGFVDALLSATHSVEKRYEGEGYVVCKPLVSSVRD